MNDSSLQADLRDYFGAVAAQRPADGELARAVAATSLVRPRPAWTVQLEELLRPLRAPAETGLRVAILLALLLLALALLAIGAAIASRPRGLSTPFEGRWLATDLGDASDMLLVVSAGSSPTIRFEDFYASACAKSGDNNTHWLAHGSGSIVKDALMVSYENGGGCTTWQIEPYAETFTRDPKTNTLTDTAGNTWRMPAR